MHIIVGLGNPGKKYDKTRHNVGFDVIDKIAENNNIDINKIKHKAVVGEGRINNKKVMLVKPTTYMNLSGQSVKEIVDYYKVNISDIIVIYDDIDTQVGKMRIRQKGSAGSHNGMKSIIYDLVDDSFPRVRIGIGKPEFGDLADFVLGKFSKEQKPLIEDVVNKAADAVEIMIKDGIDLAMNRYNG